MANDDAPRGFQPVRMDGASCDSGGVNAYVVAAGDTTALFIGDPVIITGTAAIPTVASEFKGHTLPVVTIATAAGGSYVSGVVVGVEPITAESLVYRAASTQRVVYVNDDPDQLFMIQEDSDGGALAVTATQSNADFIIGSGSTTTGLSAVEIDSSTEATTATLQLRLERFAPREDNALGANVDWIVRLNLHQKRNTTGV